MIIPYYKVSKKLVELCLIAKQKKTGIYQSHLILYFYLSYLPGLNRRPPPYQGDALPTELKQQVTEFWVKKKNSASRTRTYDIMINSHALLPTELLRNI